MGWGDISKNSKMRNSKFHPSIRVTKTRQKTVRINFLWTLEVSQRPATTRQKYFFKENSWFLVSTNGIPVPSLTPYISSSWENNSLHFWYQSGTVSKWWPNHTDQAPQPSTSNSSSLLIQRSWIQSLPQALVVFLACSTLSLNILGLWIIQSLLQKLKSASTAKIYS